MWSLAWGIFFFLLRSRGIDYGRHALWTAGYFLSVAIITSAVFWRYILKAAQGFTPTPFVILAIFMAVQFILYVLIPKYFPEPKGYFEKYPNREYLKMDRWRLVSKSMDLLAQQVFIVLLVTFLYESGLSFYQILIAFGILFGFLHIPLIVSERSAWPAWVFGGIVVVFSIIFPTLILKVHYGFVYNYMIHWAFYTVTAISFCVWSAKRRELTFG